MTQKAHWLLNITSGKTASSKKNRFLEKPVINRLLLLFKLCLACCVYPPAVHLLWYFPPESMAAHRTEDLLTHGALCLPHCVAHVFLVFCWLRCVTKIYKSVFQPLSCLFGIGSSRCRRGVWRLLAAHSKKSREGWDWGGGSAFTTKVIMALQMAAVMYAPASVVL